MRLSELQLTLSDAIIGTAPGLDHSLVRNLADTGAGLQVYQRNHFANLHTALRDHFPAVEALVGEGFFRTLVRDFISAHPPGQGDLNSYGESLPGFIAVSPHTASLPYLADVAALEWAQVESFQSPPDSVLTSEQVLASQERGLPVVPRLHRSVRVIAVNYPVTEIWNYAVGRSSEIPEVTPRAAHVMTWLAEDGAQQTYLSTSEASVLADLQGGDALRLDAAEHAEAVLARLLTRGALGQTRNIGEG